MTEPGLEHAADELPAERVARSPITILGAAHYWAARAKEAEVQAEKWQTIARRARRALAWAVVAAAAAGGGVAWVLG